MSIGYFWQREYGSVNVLINGNIRKKKIIKAFSHPPLHKKGVEKHFNYQFWVVLFCERAGSFWRLHDGIMGDIN